MNLTDQEVQDLIKKICGPVGSTGPTGYPEHPTRHHIGVNMPSPTNVSIPIEHIIKNLVCPNRADVKIRVTIENWEEYDRGATWGEADATILIAVKLPNGVIHRAGCKIVDFPHEETIALLRAATL
jgi:hypothetical protein